MKRFYLCIEVVFLILILIACAPSIEIKNFDQYKPIKLQKTEILPTEKDLEYKDYNIAVAVDTDKIRVAKKANLSHILSNILENILEQTGNVNIVSREQSGKLLHEVLIAEDKQISGWEGEQFASYFLFGKITKASFNRKYQAAFYSKLSGLDINQHYYPARCIYTAFVSGDLKIYKMPSMKILKTIHFEDNKQAGEETESKDLCQNKLQSNHLLAEAMTDGIRSIRTTLFNYFTHKGYILSGKQKNGDMIFETTLMKKSVKPGDKIVFYRLITVKNPLTNGLDIIEEKIADGLVTTLSNSKRTWVRVIDSAIIKIGDIVKPHYLTTNKDFFKQIGKQINRINMQ